ncbi:SDR family oxidoreductase [Rhodococcus koreensis]
MNLELEGSVALITAASKGIGYAIAERLALEGTEVVISSRPGPTLDAALERLRAIAPAPVHAVPADLLRPGAGTELIMRVIAERGRLDILVSNSPGPPIKPVLDTTDEDWDDAYAALLRPAVQLGRAAAQHMSDRGSGAMVFITSTWVKQANHGGVLSAALRSGVSAFAKQLANELSHNGIRVNQLMPGATETERMQKIIAAKTAQHGTTADEELAQIVSSIPMGRWASPEEIADAVAFLVSKRTGFLTGQALAVDGGAIRATL